MTVTPRPWMAVLLVGAPLATASLAVASPDQDRRVRAPAVSVKLAAGPADVAKATRFLRGRRFSTHLSGGGGGTSTIDRNYDMCAGGRFRYESTFLNAALDSFDQDVYSGRWKVTRARVAPDGSGLARVRLVTDQGTRGRITLTANSRGVYVDGQPAEFGASSVCGD